MYVYLRTSYCGCALSVNFIMTCNINRWVGVSSMSQRYAICVPLSKSRLYDVKQIMTIFTIDGGI